MNEFLLKSFISKITISDIEKFSLKNNIKLKNNELIMIEKQIKKNWRTIIYGNPRPILDEIKKEIDLKEYEKIEKLYIEFKNKYNNYL